MDLCELAERLKATHQPDPDLVGESIREAVAQAETEPDRKQTVEELRTIESICYTQAWRYPFLAWEWEMEAKKAERAIRVLCLPPRPVAPAPVFLDGSRQRSLDRWLFKPSAPEDPDCDL